MNVSDRILADLENRVGFDHEIDFMNIYKGVPLVYKGSLEDIKEDTVIFKVQPPDSVCLTWDQYTFLLDEHFISGIRARVLDFNINTGEVTLSEFDYSERGFGERLTARVEPEKPIEVQLEQKEHVLPGRVSDISLSGFGVHVDLPKDDLPKIKQVVTLNLRLINTDIKIPGTIMGIKQVEGRQRLAIHFEADAPGHDVISKYITGRRAEIREEIQSKYTQIRTA